jgi:crotonobetainyl-CoA:carnitine CoA-transferase CaiB-like acyl-CoA transferase
MTRSTDTAPPLAGIRVLDLATPRGEMAGRMLADLGADVVKVEPPGGAGARRLGPFAPDGRSLFFESYAAGKRSVVLDPGAPGDRQRLLGLVRDADVFIESDAPGVMRAHGLHYEALSALNERLVYLSISPFGQHGPKAAWPATDLTIEAIAGRVAMQGDADRPPLPIGYPQAGLHAAAQGAADVVVALNERALSGRGQYLDLSMFETMFWTLMAVQGTRICQAGAADAPAAAPRAAAAARTPMQALLQLLPSTLMAQDGYVTLGPGAVLSVLAVMVRLWREEGRLPPALADFDLATVPAHVRDGTLPAEVAGALREVLFGFVGERTQVQLVQFAHQHDLRLGPFYTPQSILDDPHYNARGFIASVDGVRRAGPWVQLSRTPLAPARRAPALGEGGDAEWAPRGSAVGPQASAAGPRPDAAPLAREARRGDAFAGLRVADFSWVAAGPTMTKALADHGATVVKLESSTRPDLSRTLGPFLGGQQGLNRSYWSCLYMTSKYSLQCNLGTPEGVELARRVVAWADVVVESFSPGTMRKLGLDYATLSRDRPDLIMLSTSLLGQTGPLASYAGFGQQGSGFSGHHAITGWPDRVPCGVYSPYTDVVSPKFGIAALGAAVLERRRSGRGQHVDLSQAESSVHFIAPLLLDAEVNGRVAGAAGLDSLYACPHGVYPCIGEREFVAIAVETDAQWQALRALVPGLPDVAAGYAARHAQRDAIDAVLAAWTAPQDRDALEASLIAAGVPAAAVRRPVEVYDDPQVEARGFRQRLRHSEAGDVEIWGFPTRFSAREVMVPRAPPCLGEHNEFVLRDLLGLDDASIERYRAANVLV